MVFKSRSVFPPGGWRFRQPQTGWPADEQYGNMRKGFTFDQWVEAIIAHRAANPRFSLPTDFETVAMELEIYTAAIIMRIPGSASYLTRGGEFALPKLEPRLSPLEKGVDTVAGRVGKVVAGARIILDWIGSGGRPVPVPLALTRAATCVDCALNTAPDWTSWATGLVARSIKEQLEAKNAMGLDTPVDDKLRTCSACTCWIPLKIWCPIEHILERTTEQGISALDPGCWVIRELDHKLETSTPKP